MTWNGYIDGIRVDVVRGGFAAGWGMHGGIVVRECPWDAAWAMVRRVMGEQSKGADDA